MSTPIFISYSHKDARWLTIIEPFLKQVVREMKFVPWDDRQINPGSDWRAEIKRAIDGARAAILLVSSDFLASDFIHSQELPPILEAARTRGLKIFWIPVRHSAYENTELERYQALGNPKAPLSTLSKAAREGELVEICGQIARACATAPAGSSGGGNGGGGNGGGGGPRTDAAAVESSSRSASRGFEALVELMTRDGSVQRNVGAFKAVLGATLRQIEILLFYKGLHDNLHTLQFKCYDYLKNVVRMAKMSPDDFAVWDNVIEYELMLQDIVGGLVRASERRSSAYTPPDWVPTLVTDLRALFEAVKSNDVDKIGPCMRPIQKVLALQPSRLNDRLVEAARALPLPALVDALTGVRDSLDRGRANPEALRQFQEGVAALSALDASLTTLTGSHSRWQEIDQEIRLAEGTLSQGFDDLKFSWPALKKMAEAQCGDGSQAWAGLLLEEIKKLDDALAADDASKIRQHFQRFRRRANEQFYQVDLELMQLCEKLSMVSTPLAKVWEMIQ